MGYLCQVYVELNSSKTWDFHSQRGYYHFTSGDHYQTHNTFTRNTKAERLSDTVDFHRRRITRPTISHADRVVKALTEFFNAIKSMTKGATACAKTKRASKRA